LKWIFRSAKPLLLKILITRYCTRPLKREGEVLKERKDARRELGLRAAMSARFKTRQHTVALGQERDIATFCACPFCARSRPQ